ncbi:hypothetical protein [Weissella cibaria]|nr:hypothetical protein [Weissella cibaria]
MKQTLKDLFDLVPAATYLQPGFVFKQMSVRDQLIAQGIILNATHPK